LTVGKLARQLPSPMAPLPQRGPRTAARSHSSPVMNLAKAMRTAHQPASVPSPMSALYGMSPTGSMAGDSSIGSTTFGLLRSQLAKPVRLRMALPSTRVPLGHQTVRRLHSPETGPLSEVATGTGRSSIPFLPAAAISVLSLQKTPTLGTRCSLLQEAGSPSSDTLAPTPHLTTTSGS
jgi:hypothetical protein